MSEVDDAANQETSPGSVGRSTVTYYFHCMTETISRSVPAHKYLQYSYNVPGWNDYVKEKHDVAREAYLLWHDCGKRRYFENMKRTGSQFKLGTADRVESQRLC